MATTNGILSCFSDNATGNFSLKNFMTEICGDNTDRTPGNKPAYGVNSELNLDQAF